MRRKSIGFTLSAMLYALSLVGAMLFALCWSAEAQQPGKVPRIGLLMSSSTAETAPFIDALRQGLRELGYVEGKNIVLEIRGGGAKPDRLSDLAADLVRLKVGIIVTGGSTATRAAKEVTSTIPIVMRTGGDPVKSGIVSSLAHPGGNITGVASINLGLIGKRLELLLEVVPGVTHITVLAAQSDRVGFMATDEYKEMEAAARALGVKLQILWARDASAIDNAFLAMSKGRAEALIVIPNPRYFQNRKRIIKHAAKNRLPSIYPHSIYAENGGLISYGVDFVDENRRLAIYVDKILKGSKPADLPIQQPTKFEFIINLKTAKQIGLAIPPNVLARA
ncbi:MAG: ABC transporter substrate-binding protein, partial [Candidatus Binatia bacterium]